MIVFDLKCEEGHLFESWFRSSSAYEEQKAAGLIECPYCGSPEVEKAPMAPNVGAKGNQKTEVVTDKPKALDVATPAPTMAAPSPELRELANKAAKAMADLQQHVEKNCENVGKDFAEEARKMHYGESEERGIYGESSLEEAQDLIEEGIDVMPLPGVRRTDA